MTSNVLRYTERKLALFASSPRYTATDARPLATRNADLWNEHIGSSDAQFAELKRSSMSDWQRPDSLAWRLEQFANDHSEYYLRVTRVQLPEYRRDSVQRPYGLLRISVLIEDAAAKHREQDAVLHTQRAHWEEPRIDTEPCRDLVRFAVDRRGVSKADRVPTGWY